MLILGPSEEEQYEIDVAVKDESKEWMGVCYDENIIEYDEYSDYQDDDGKVEIDVEVHSENVVEFTENIECDQVQFEHYDADLHGYQLDEEEVSTIPDNEQNSVIQVYHEVEEVTTSHRQLENSSDRKQQQLNRNLRRLRLKCFIQRENNRLKRKSMNCRICGTHHRFLHMQIRALRAEKQKLLEETSILRLTKKKLSNQLTSTESLLTC